MLKLDHHSFAKKLTITARTASVDVAAATSMIGRPVTALPTPALVADLPTMDANIHAMSQWMSVRGKQWRPHAKCHKSAAIAQRQLHAGAIGATVATVNEAEGLAAGGISDLLLGHCVVQPGKLARIAKLCHTASPIVCCDHYSQAELLSRASQQEGVVCRVLMDVNLGMNRTGIRPGPDAHQLATGIATLPGVKLVGVFGYEGHLLRISDVDEKRRKIMSAMSTLVQVQQELTELGFDLPIISAGGTGSYQFSADAPGVTEIQAGGGMFADPFYSQECGVTGLTPSLGVLAMVVSRPKLERAVLDCGKKSLSPDVFPPQVVRLWNGPPLPDAQIVMHSAEHMTLELGPESRLLKIGDFVLLRPGYSDLTTLLHRHMYGYNDETIEAVFPVG